MNSSIMDEPRTVLGNFRGPQDFFLREAESVLFTSPNDNSLAMRSLDLVPGISKVFEFQSTRVLQYRID